MLKCAAYPFLHYTFVALKKSTVNIVVVLILISLICVLFFQGMWLKHSYENGHRQFDRSVITAMNEAVQALEKRLVFNMFNNEFDGDTMPKGQVRVLMQHTDTERRVDVIKYDSIVHIQGLDDTLKYITRNHSQMHISGDSFTIKLKNRVGDIVGRILNDIQTDTLATRKPLLTPNLDSVLTVALKQKGITNKFDYGIRGIDGKILQKSEGFSEEDTAGAYKVLMYPFHIAVRPDVLMVRVYNRHKTVYPSIMPVFIASLVFTVFMMITCWLSIRTILRQKKISTIKNDFINNMTHEFKTPIATIGLAADALKETGSEQVVHFASIIKQESLNMNQKVETILQMALLEQQQVKLALRVLSVHALLEQAQAHFELQLKAKQAIVKTDLAATIPNVLADALHLTNVFANVIDNALKYSEGQPVLHITTKNQGGQVVISISDEGIGMSKEEQKRVFDKFYRAQSGNIHNTKGFGLGLSYALQIVQLHKGTITLESTKNKGTTVTISLPVINE